MATTLTLFGTFASKFKGECFNPDKVACDLSLFPSRGEKDLDKRTVRSTLSEDYGTRNGVFQASHPLNFSGWECHTGPEAARDPENRLERGAAQAQEHVRECQRHVSLGAEGS